MKFCFPPWKREEDDGDERDDRKKALFSSREDVIDKSLIGEKKKGLIINFQVAAHTNLYSRMDVKYWIALTYAYSHSYFILKKSKSHKNGRSKRKAATEGHQRAAVWCFCLKTFFYYFFFFFQFHLFFSWFFELRGKSCGTHGIPSRPSRKLRI